MKKIIEKTTESDQEIHQGDEGEYFKVSEVFQATVGRHNFGIWTTIEEAKKHIEANAPGAKPAESPPISSRPLQDGYFYIQPRSVFSHKPPVQIQQ